MSTIELDKRRAGLSGAESLLVVAVLCFASRIYTNSVSTKTLYVFIHSPASFLCHVPTFIFMICCAHSPKWLGFSNFTGHWHTYVSDALIRMQKKAAASDCRCSLDQTRATGVNIFLQTDDKFRQHIYSWLHFLLNKWASLGHPRSRGGSPPSEISALRSVD